ncbi:MAG TPA: DUF5671 domain-containing protein [Agromyces sp.]|nr:DUF5671 domain-containing protein [Agromyces sp.]
MSAHESPAASESSAVHATSAAGGSASRTVRRLIISSLLFALVTIAAIGLAGLLERLLDPDTRLALGGTADLARSLAFALIAGPLAAVLWWVWWRRLAHESERSSLAWGLYLASMYTVSLIVATGALVAGASVLVDGRWRPGDFATGAVWAGVWVWHRWMWRNPRRRPTRLATVPAVAGSVFGLVIGVRGAVSALGDLLDTAIRGASEQAIAGGPWWRMPLEALIWAVAGGLVWWWHWFHDDARRLRTGLAGVALVVVGVLGSGIVMLGGLGTALFVALRLLFDHGDPAREVLGPLGTAIAAASVGAVVWLYHRRIAAARSQGTRRASILVMSGVGLAAAASGVGVIVNATLASLASPLAASDTRTLLLGGVSALIVGGPVWWLNWRPTRRMGSAELVDPGRRVYLIAVFGLSAVVALIALLVVGYRLFEFWLDPSMIGGVVDRVRAPLGLLVATGLVFAYHFAVWRRDRSLIAREGLPTGRRIGRVILVAAGDPTALQRVIADATGAPVTVWRRSEDETPTGPDAAVLAAALDGVTGKRVLVLAGPGDRVEVVPLQE